MDKDRAQPATSQTDPAARGRDPLRRDIRRLNRWYWLPGVLAVCAVMGILVVLKAAAVPAPNPGSCLLIAVAFASVVGRVRSGLISAALCIVFTIFYFSTDGAPFHYTGQAKAHLVINSILLIVMALMVGLLKLRNDKLILERVHRVEQLANERARADANLQRFAELESIVEGMPAGVFIGTPEGMMLCNKIGLRMVGVETFHELLAIFPTIFDKIQARWIDTGAPVAPQDRPFTVAFRGESTTRDMRYVRLGDGAVVTARCAAAPIIADGKITAGVAIFTDITERIRMEESLRESEEGYRRLIETSAEGIWTFDLDGHTTFVNEMMANMVGLTPAEMVGRSYIDFIDLRQNPLGAQVNPLELSCRDDVKLVTADGRDLWTIVSSTRIVDKSGQPIGTLSMVTDITDRKIAEAKIAAVYEREHRIAEVLQRSLLLNREELRFPGYFVEAFYQPALDEAMVGGDFFDAFPLDGGLTAFVVGDVSGKGLEAAAHTAEAKFTVRALLREYPSPSVALARMNDVLCDRQRIEKTAFDGFICLVIAVADTRTGQIDISVAGAEPPVLVRADKRVEVLTPDGGLPLGVIGKQDYGVHVVHVDIGDILMVTTDGLTEARKSPGQFGLEGICSAAIDAHDSASLSDYAKAIVKSASDFAGGVLHDDVCLLMVQRLQPHQYLPEK